MFIKNFARALIPAAMSPPRCRSQPRIARHGAVKAHLTSVQTMTANFVQTDAEGRAAAGTLQLKRPGQVRFQYGSGDLLLVADGRR